MSTISGTESKLKMLGNTILCKNGFVVVYRDPYKVTHTIKLTKTRNGVKTQIENGVQEYRISKYFMCIYDPFGNGDRIFVRNSEINLAKNIGSIYYTVAPNEQGETIFDEKIPWDSPILVVVSMKSRIYLINYTGKIIDITPKSKIEDGFNVAVTFDSKKHRYYIGFSMSRYDEKTRMRKVSVLNKIILATDRNLKDIKYFNI